MFGYICFFIALAIIALFVALALQKRSNASKAISCILIGVFFATFFMVLPTQWLKEGKEVFSKPLYTVLSSLLYSFKALSGRQDIAQLETMALPGFLKAVYIGVNYICFALAPILASSLILSFIGDTGEKMRFFLRSSPKCYVFSEINENALALADGIKTKPGKKTIVFCNAKGIDKELIAKAKKLGGIVLHKPCNCLKIGNRFQVYAFCLIYVKKLIAKAKKLCASVLHKPCNCSEISNWLQVYEFYLISPDEDSNIRMAETVIGKYVNTQDAKIHINAFVESGTNVNFLETIFKNKDNPTNLELHCIDEIALFCNNLIYNYPLYNTKENGNNISVAIVGCGRMGMRMLKTAYWAGQIDGYNLKIRVYDKDAAARQEDFYSQCPGLKDEKAIGFVPVDVSSLAFKEQLLAAENSADATYIVVAMDNDQLNLSVADELYRIYRRHFKFRDERMPEIFTRVRSQAKSDPHLGNAEFLAQRHIHLFGTTASLFSDKALFDTELENLAFAVHLTYHTSLHLDKNAEKYKEIRKDFKTSEYSRRSSMATALHIPAKLCMCDSIPKTGKNTLTPENIEVFARCLKTDSSLCTRLAVNEHRRWNAFMLSEGYQAASEEEMHMYAASVDSHKDDLSMLHPCITTWEALDKLQDTYNSTYNKDKKFKDSDITIVESIPDIWMVAQQLNGED